MKFPEMKIHHTNIAHPTVGNEVGFGGIHFCFQEIALDTKICKQNPPHLHIHKYHFPIKIR